MKYQFIAMHRQDYPISTMCRVLQVSVSGYYAWHNRAPSQRSREDALLSELIECIYRANRQVYGSPRIHAALHADGHLCGKKRVARLMRRCGISAKAPRHRSRTTDSRHTNPVAENVLDRDFTASAPNTRWVADITGVWTMEGWLYLAVVLDIFSRMVVGWAMDKHREAVLVKQAALMALARRHPEPGLLHHSDRGSQYTCYDYQALLACYGIQVSMSRKGDCYDNALMESFIGTLKTECVEQESYHTRTQARHSIFEYLEVFYNRQRLHSSLGYVSPVMFEQQVK